MKTKQIVTELSNEELAERVCLLDACDAIRVSIRHLAMLPEQIKEEIDRELKENIEVLRSGEWKREDLVQCLEDIEAYDISSDWPNRPFREIAASMTNEEIRQWLEREVAAAVKRLRLQ